MTALPPILMYPGSRRSRRPILNTDGQDIRPMLERAAAEAEVPLELLLAGVIAESGINPRAERWGAETELARTLLESGDMAGLARVIARAGDDISFGYSQRVVRYHWAGNGTLSVSNCLAVRALVFAEPEEDLLQMAFHLAWNLYVARDGDLRRVGGDPLLAALVVYNAGHLPYPDDPWWERWAANVESYRRALASARGLL